MLINKYKGYYNDSEISKYHIVNDNFKESEIIKIKAYIKTHYSLVEVTEHFERSCKDIGENFKLHPLWYILKNGKCFEYGERPKKIEIHLKREYCNHKCRI